MPKPAWSTVTPATGTYDATVDVSATLHEGRAQRSGTLTVKTLSGAPAKTKAVALIQQPSGALLTIDNATVNADHTAQTIVITGKSNMAALSFDTTRWATNNDAYITALKIDGQQMAVPDSMKQANASYNETIDAPTGSGESAMYTFEITVQLLVNTENVNAYSCRFDMPISGTWQYFVIKRTGAPVRLTVYPTVAEIATNGGSSILAINANCNWQANADYPSWLSVSPISGSKNSEVTVTAAQHTGLQSRTCSVNFANTDGSPATTATSSITQLGAEEFLMFDELQYSAGNTTTTIHVTGRSNALQLSFSKQDEVAWISGATNLTIDGAPATFGAMIPGNPGYIAEYAFEFDVQLLPNYTVHERTAAFTITTLKPISANCGITQAAAEPIMTVVPISLQYAANDTEPRLVQVTTNMEWQRSISNEFVHFSGQTNGKPDGTTPTTTFDMYVSVDAYTGRTERIGNFSINAMEEPYDDPNEYRELNPIIALTQLGKPAFCTIQAIADIDYDTTTVALSGTSNCASIDFACNVDGATIADFTPDLSSDPGATEEYSWTATLNLPVYDEVVQRTVTVTATGANADAVAVNITQAAAPSRLFTEPSSIILTAAGTAQQLTIRSNTAWHNTTKPDWLTVLPAEGTKDATVNLSAVAYTGRIDRTASSAVFITTAGTPAVQSTISVAQSGSHILSFTSATSGSVSYAGGSITVTGIANTDVFTQTALSAGLSAALTANGQATAFGAGVAGDPGATAQYEFSIVLTAARNEDTAARALTLTFNTALNSPQTLTVNQGGFDGGIGEMIVESNFFVR